jgi:uncharacterized protein (TIGR02453 family)
MTPTITAPTFQFLEELSKNNNRDWFNQNKLRYTAAHENIIAFADALLAEMQTHDVLETPSGKASLMRIYNDTRFSKDKTPYKTYFCGGFRRASKLRRGGYYFQLGPNNSMAAGGFFSPSPEDTLRIRKDMDMNFSDWDTMLSQETFKTTFGTMKGETVATAPKGFSKDNPAIELLRHKQFYFERRFTDKEVLSGDFLELLNTTFKNIRPYFDYMSDVLTIDLNGRLIT